VQSSYYRDIFLSLGLSENKIVVSGNMKFEGITVINSQLKQLKERYYPVLKPRPCTLLVAGSTHYPEEDMLLGIYKDIREYLRIPLVLVIAPRHIERLPQIEKSIISLGFNSKRITQVIEGSTNENTVFILDTIGDLPYFYSFADICFVGGSFVDYGGHNILEPIYFSKPTIFGPHMDNFRDIEEIILEHGAGIKADSAQELKDALIRLLNDSTLRNNLETKCHKVFEKEQEGLRETLNIISKCLRDG
jgi:3-deoxy-D-manno-octulosonic-acid transferase